MRSFGQRQHYISFPSTNRGSDITPYAVPTAVMKRLHELFKKLGCVFKLGLRPAVRGIGLVTRSAEYLLP